MYRSCFSPAKVVCLACDGGFVGGLAGTASVIGYTSLGDVVFVRGWLDETALDNVQMEAWAIQRALETLLEWHDRGCSSQ